MGKSASWPALRTPVVPLELEILLKDQVLLVPHFFTAKQCGVWSTFIHALDMQASAKPKRGEAYRSNERISLMDKDFAERLWRETGLAELLSKHEAFRGAQGLNENIRCYRYAAKQRFERHYDDSVRVGNLVSRYTLLLYISGQEDGVHGGETAFYPLHAEPLIVEPRRGLLLLHKHGADCLLHEGRAVTGEVPKLVLRTDVLFTQ